MQALFAFDIQSRATMLVAGDKAGTWSKCCSLADSSLAAYDEHLTLSGTCGHDKVFQRRAFVTSAALA